MTKQPCPEDVTELVDQAIVAQPPGDAGDPTDPPAGDACPTLPARALADPRLAEGACPWLDDYIAFSRQWSPRAYDHFHEAVGLWMLSTVAAGRVMMHFGGERYPSLYIVLCARTSLFTKTTTAKIGLQTLKAAGLDWLLLSDDMTPQKFISDLAGQLPEGYDGLAPAQQERAQARLALSGQRGWFYEEFGQQLSAMMRQNGVMADFRGLLRRLDDQREVYAYGTISRGNDTVNQPYLALLANLTPAELQAYARPGGPLWHDGFYARFAFVAPPAEVANLRGQFPQGARIVPPAVVEPLVDWHRRLGMPEVRLTQSEHAAGDVPRPPRVERAEMAKTVCVAGAGLHDAYYAYYDALLDVVEGSRSTDLDGNYARMAEKALRVAMLMASLDPESGNRVELRHWARAQQITERWRADLHHLVSALGTPAESRGEHDEDRVSYTLNRLCSLGRTPTAREIRQYTKGVTTQDVERILAALVRSGLVSVESSGRTNRYRVGAAGLLAKGASEDAERLPTETEEEAEELG